jgi:DNA-binding MarR family transcriptional regulator
VNLIKDLSRLCADLDYKYSIKIEASDYACLYILSSSLSKFYKDYAVLKNEYPEADLGYKGLKIKEFIDRVNKPRVYTPGNKDAILNMLSKEPLTVNELATRLRMTRQGARYLIHKLEKENKIEVKFIVKFANWKYGVKNADRNCR